MIQVGLVSHQIVSKLMGSCVFLSGCSESTSDVSDTWKEHKLLIHYCTWQVVPVRFQINNLILRWHGKDIAPLWLSVSDNHSPLSLCLIYCLKAKLKQNFWLCPAAPPFVSQAVQLNLSEIAKGDRCVCCLSMSWHRKNQTERFRNRRRRFCCVLALWWQKRARVSGLGCLLVFFSPSCIWPKKYKGFW